MKECTQGNWCPVGVKDPLTCPGLSECPKGSSSVDPTGSILAIIFIFLGLGLVQYVNNYYTRHKRKMVTEHISEFAGDQGKELADIDQHDARSIQRMSKVKGSMSKGVADVANPMGNPGDEKQTTDAKEEADTKQDLAETKGAGSLVMDDGEASLDIMFKDMWLVLPNGRAIMKGVSGRFAKGRSVAVMGPSGAGKSTLLNLLMGRAPRTRGTVFINGKEDELFNYSDLIGFVPQEDVMLRQLTVYDILRFSSDFRLPADFTHEQRKKICIETLKFLEIDHVVHSIIGDERKRGVSGGQRKRVNIGMELVARPKVLFLDEPTSGLDSVTSLILAQLLRKLARQMGISVAAVIHSPSRETFENFDDLTLLGAGGQIIYQGAVDRAPAYFASIGFPVPEEDNPADFYLEVAMGKVKRHPLKGEPEEPVVNLGHGRHFDPKRLFPMWVHKGQEWRSDELKDIPDPDAVDDHKDDEKPQKPVEKAKDFCMHASEGPIHYWSEVLEEFWHFITCYDPKKARKTPNYLRIYLWCCRRTAYQVYRSGTWLYWCVLHVGLGLFLSAMGTSYFVGPTPENLCDTAPTALLQRCILPINDPVLGIGTFIIWVVSFAAMVEGIQTFGGEEVVYWRHASKGLPTIPYFLAKVTMDFPKMVMDAALFMLGLTAGYSITGSSDILYALLLMLYWVGYSFGYLISITSTPRNRALYCVLFSMMWTLVFSGAVVSLNNIQEEYSDGLAWIWSISYARWGLEVWYVNEVSFYDYLAGMGPNFDQLKYNTGSMRSNLWIMFALGLFWQFVTFLLMKLFNRDKVK